MNIIDQIGTGTHAPKSMQEEITKLRADLAEREDEIASLKARLNQAGVELSQCILDKMEQAKQLAECKKEGLILRRSVIRHRQQMFKDVDQTVVINREFPYLAAMAQKEEA